MGRKDIWSGAEVKHNVVVANTALQGERADEAGKQRKLIDKVWGLFLLCHVKKGKIRNAK